MLQEKDLFTEIEQIIDKDAFYKEEHSKIYCAIYDLDMENKPVDILTVMDQLRRNNDLEAIGGPAYLTQLTARVGSGAHADYHARVIQQNYLKREVIRLAMQMQNEAYNESIDVDELIDKAQTGIGMLALGNVKKFAKRIGDIGKDHIKKLEEKAKDDSLVSGVPSLPVIDHLTSGWQPGNLIILAARPAMGKSMIAQFFSRWAAKQNNPILIFSLEMAQSEIYERELSANTGIENIHIRRANFTEEDWSRIEESQAKIEKLDIYVDDTPSLKLTEFKSKARLAKKKHNISMIVIDYLQLMKHPEFAWNREREISEISGSLKAMAKELDIPIMALSQLNRDIEKRGDPTPKLSDLRESGAIEQDADIILFPYRPEAAGIEYDENEISTKNRIDLIFAKFRAGVTGTIRLYKTTKWTDITGEDVNETPEDIF
jgi:replicative DNA helicase